MGILHLPGLHIVLEDCSDFSLLLYLPQEKPVLSQNRRQATFSCSIFAARLSNNHNKLHDGLQLWQSNSTEYLIFAGTNKNHCVV